MKNRALYSLIPLVALVGCSLFPREPDTKGAQTASAPTKSAFQSEGPTYKCHERDKCRVTVTVTACAAGGITPYPYTLRVSPKLRDVAIVWTLRAPAGFSFAPEGVFFKEKDLTKQFGSAKHSADQFVWQDANTTPGKFPYGIRVRRDGRDCAVLDPIVINDDVVSP